MQKRPLSFIRPMTLALLVALAGCGVPGVQVEPSPTPAAGLSPDIEATVAAQVQASVVAQAAAPTEAPAVEPTEAPAVEPTEAPAVEPTEAPAAPVAAGASGDAALVLVGENATVSAVVGGGWAEVGAPFATFTRCGDDTRVAVDAGGRFWANCLSDLYVSDDGVSWEPAPDEMRGRPYPTAQGPVYVIGGASIYRHADGETTAYTPQEAIGEEIFPAYYATIAPDGTLWMAGTGGAANDLASFDGESWQTYGAGLMPEGALASSPRQLHVGADGTLYTVSGGGLYRFDGERFEELLTPEELTAPINQFLTTEANGFAEPRPGELWVATNYGILIWDGAAVRAETRATGLPVNQVHRLAVDGGGRVWAATAHGVAVRGEGGWQIAVPSTAGLGDAYLWGLGVRGAPELPAPDAEVRTATVRGRISRDGQALAGAQVQLCSEVVPGSDYTASGATPCEQNLYSQVVTADDQGNFTFADVPLGVYGIAFQPAGEDWRAINIIGDYIKALESGAEVVYDLPL